MQIADVLSRKGRAVTTVRDTDRVAKAVQVLADRNIGAAVVQDQWSKLVGIFSERDLVRAVARHGPEALALGLGEVMTRNVMTCVPTDLIDDAVARMTRNRFRHLPVVEQGKLAGIVSLGDLVHFRLDEKALEASVLLDMARMHA